MSSLWNLQSAAAATRIDASAIAPAVDPAFAPWARLRDAGYQMFDAVAPAPAPATPRETAYAEGYAAGRDAVLAELAGERAALAALAGSLQACRAEPPELLAAVLAEVVGRLVAEIVGATRVDGHVLREHADAVARIVADQAGPARLRLHPDDAALLADAALDHAVVADAAIAPGNIVCETASGWIEHGPDAAIERLRQALDELLVTR